MNELHQKKIKAELYHDNFQNFKKYNIPERRSWLMPISHTTLAVMLMPAIQCGMRAGDNEKTVKESKKSFFNSDGYFKIAEYMHFCSRLLKPKDQRKRRKAPAMIVFCAFDQMPMVAEYGKKYGFEHRLSDILHQELFGAGT